LAKRFTDTAKWDKPWFRELGSQGRDIWFWLYDHCEACGVWEIDLKRMSFELGFEVTIQRVLEIMKGAEMIGDNKLWLPGFIAFQYGRLSEDCKPHQAIIRRLKALTLWKGYTKAIVTLEEEDKEKEQDKEKEEDPKKLAPSQLLKVWNERRGPLPRAVSLTGPRKNKAFAQIDKYPDLEHWLTALEKFKASEFCINTWRPGIDDWLSESKRIRAIEGKYDGDSAPTGLVPD